MTTKYVRLAEGMNDVMERVTSRLEDLGEPSDAEAAMAITVALVSVADEIRQLREHLEGRAE